MICVESQEVKCVPLAFLGGGKGNNLGTLVLFLLLTLSDCHCSQSCFTAVQRSARKSLAALLSLKHHFPSISLCQEHRSPLG